ncbi:regulating synaptic membrane exocytosis protein 2-like isoform X3 [Amphibalanus amphitrite]|uniref:regulating synaptic membrane exocytosis protein 2-like isoform X3 n=1 Tax=Amphibalanus amphitrite TaxID=1232801 RepID=UPI001C906D48|nr:regulating synaptic membrane exocytosis protein 2-like isoform X3 [Amphibalanus amphitrite]
MAAPAEPDLSHLTEDERRIIEMVMERQRREEDKENEVVRRKQDEVRLLEDRIRQRGEQQRKAGVELDATCQICLKTKFADGIGHTCNYCSIRCCAKCSGKVTLRSGKVIWVCILCRKKQELLIKTGKWIQGGMGSHSDDIRRRMEADLRSEAATPTSEAERGRMGLHRTSSLQGRELSRAGSLQGRELRRQYSHDRPPPEPSRAAAGSSAAAAAAAAAAVRGRPGGERASSACGYTRRLLPESADELRPLYPSDELRRTHLDTPGRHRKIEVRTDSLSSDQSESVRPPPPKPHKHRRRTRQHSVSSSDDEIRSTPECTSGGEEEVESTESISEKGELDYYERPRSRAGMGDARARTEKRKKVVRFDGYTGPGPGDFEEQTSQESQTRDSGIDLASCLTSSEESWKTESPKHPVTWQPSADGSRLVGHMILKKAVKEAAGGQSASSAAILGLKVVGGKRLSGDRLGAAIERVKKGSIADSVGHLRPGDEVIEWNGRSLQGKTFEEVYDIIAESRQEPQVELIVYRTLAEGRRRHTHAGIPSSQPAFAPVEPRPRRSDPARSDRDRRPSVTVTSPGSPDSRAHHPRPSVENIGGKLQAKLWYDSRTLKLIVTLLCAVDLVPRESGHLRNPYAKVFLLPDRSEKSKRRTKTLANTLEPRWGQSLIYSTIRRSELHSRHLEITVWDYDRFGCNDFLGEVLVELGTHPLRNEPEWFPLTIPEDFNLHTRHGMYIDFDRASTTASTDHLSPPSTTSRLSESDTSDVDVDECRRGAGADSSSCSPPVSERGERSTRRDFGAAGGHRARSGTVVTRDEMLYQRGAGRQEPVPYADGRSRSHSAAPYTSSGLSDRERSMSPPKRLPSRSYQLEPSHHSHLESVGSSPKKRQLPQLPTARTFGRDHLPADVETRARQLLRLQQAGGGGGGGGPARQSRHYAISDSELAGAGAERTARRALGRRGSFFSPENEQDSASDRESDTSAFSSQSEQPLGTRKSRLAHTAWQHSSFSSHAPSNLPSASNHTGGRYPRGRSLDGARRGPGPGSAHWDYPETDGALAAERRARGSTEQVARQRGLERDFKRERRKSLRQYSSVPEFGSGGTSSRTAPPPQPRRTLPPAGRARAARSDAPAGGGSSRGATAAAGERAPAVTDAPPAAASGSSATVNSVSARGAETKAAPVNSAAAKVPVVKRGSDDFGDAFKDDDLFDLSDFIAADGDSGGNDVSPSPSERGGGAGSRTALGRSASADVPEKTGRKKRLKFGSRGKNSFTVHRSEEVVHLVNKQLSSQSSDGELEELSDRSDVSSATSARLVPGMRVPEGHIADFIEGLGPGQLVGRQMLASPSLGDIQLSMCDRKGNLEVEVIRARDLQARPGSRVLPAPYVKVYLVDGKRCLSKAKTTTARRTLDPFYQQTLVFTEKYAGCVLQVTVWGDYGRMEGKKIFMGVAQIMLDDLDLSNIAIGWYKLFATSSLVSVPPAPTSKPAETAFS